MSVFLCGHLPRGLAEFPSKFLPAQAGPACAGSSTWWSFRLASVLAVAVTPWSHEILPQRGFPSAGQKIGPRQLGEQIGLTNPNCFLTCRSGLVTNISRQVCTLGVDVI